MLTTSIDLAKKVAEKNSITIDKAESVIKSFVEEVHTALKDGSAVRINNLGTLKSYVRKAHEGMNPKTGAKLQVPEMKVPSFTAAKALKTALNK